MNIRHTLHSRCKEEKVDYVCRMVVTGYRTTYKTHSLKGRIVGQTLHRAGNLLMKPHLQFIFLDHTIIFDVMYRILFILLY